MLWRVKYRLDMVTISYISGPCLPISCLSIDYPSSASSSWMSFPCLSLITCSLRYLNPCFSCLSLLFYLSLNISTSLTLETTHWGHTTNSPKGCPKCVHSRHCTHIDAEFYSKGSSKCSTPLHIAGMWAPLHILKWDLLLVNLPHIAGTLPPKILLSPKSL